MIMILAKEFNKFKINETPSYILTENQCLDKNKHKNESSDQIPIF